MFEKIGKIDDCEWADLCAYAQYNSTLQYRITVDIRALEAVGFSIYSNTRYFEGVYNYSNECRYYRTV